MSTPTPIPYEEETDPSYAEHAQQTFQVESSPDALSLRGTCKRCGDHMEYLVANVVKGWPRLRRRVTPALPAAGSSLMETVVCQCDIVHPGQPPDCRGCGAYWRHEIIG